MNIAEILRGLADKIASVEQGASIGIHRLAPVEVDNTDHTDDAVMITPLQQKQELLKKAAGVESFYDEEDTEESDPLDIVKKNAGMPVVIQNIGGEENDILG
jgi:preprotein translocase subunit Sec61beta